MSTQQEAPSATAARVLLDAVSTFRDDSAQTELALTRLREVVQLSINQDRVTVDISELIAGIMVTMTWFIDELGDAHSVSGAEVVERARAWVNSYSDFQRSEDVWRSAWSNPGA